MSQILVAIFSVGALFAVAPASVSADQGRYLYIQTNNILEDQNAVIGYERMEDGKLKMLPGSPFPTHGTGMNNNTFGKVGPHDNDSPLIISPDGKRLFTVNAHSNTIAVFDIAQDGSLRHVNGSPFPSRGRMPNSLSISGDTLVVSNRNGDYHQLAALRGKAKANYVSFRIDRNGRLRFLSKVNVKNGHKPTQVHVAQTNNRIVFGNDFQVDADFDGDGKGSWLAGTKNRVQGQLHAFMLDERGKLRETDTETLPETIEGYKYKGMPDVATLPLGIWSHPTRNLLYVGFITRNELGVYRFSDKGKLIFVTSVPNSGQDICWVLVNDAGTRIYTVNNLPRDDHNDRASTIAVYDISGDKAEKPEEIGRTLLPLPGKWFLNNRQFEQPGSTAFQMDLDPSGEFLYVISQRVCQTPTNENPEGNILHTFKVDGRGLLRVVDSRPLGPDGVPSRSRPQGVATL